MVETVVPRTPTQSSRTLRRSAHDESNPPALTPPPSDKKAHGSYGDRKTRGPASPSKSFHPMMAQAHTRTGSIGSTMPSPEQIRSMSERQLRELANGLVPSLGEARMELAHTRLQYQLLNIETREAAQRAEVEHDMTRKEVEVLQAGSPILQSRTLISPDPRSPLAQVQHQLEMSMLSNHELQANNAALDRRLKDAKRVIRYLDGRNLELDDSNKMLRERIRENREHINAMRSSGLLRSAPSSPKQLHPAQALSHSINHYATPARPRHPQVHHAPATPSSRRSNAITPSTGHPQDDPFGALLFAGEVLDAQNERASVPSTPSPTRTMRQAANHTRGSLSLSSLPITPKTSRLESSARGPSKLATANHHRRDSASTISDSSSQDDPSSRLSQEVRYDMAPSDELRGSQASQAASELLRRHPGPSSQARPSGLGLIQTKLTGKIVKSNKRSYIDRSHGSPKKQKTGKDDVGLGIGVWGGAAR